MARADAGSRPERGNRVFLILAVVAALVAAVLVFAALSGGSGDGPSSPAGTARVVVARQDVPAGATLTEEMLKIAPVAPETLLEGTYTTVTPLVGYATRYPIATGEQITLAKIGVQVRDEEGLSYVVPAGKRAIAVSVTQVSAVGGLLLPGDRVDVIAVFNAADAGGDDVVTLFQNVEVLAVAQVTQEPLPAPANTQESTEEAEVAGELPLAQRPEDVQPQPNATTVTLALTSQQAELLAVAQDKTKIWLTLRPFGTTDVVVASEDITAGTELTEEMLKIAPVTPKVLLDGTYTEVSSLVGLAPPYPIAKGEQVTLAKMGLRDEEKDGLSFIIPAGKRAIAVSVTEVHMVGGLIRTGGRVDVIAVYNEKAVTLFQDVEVLAVAQVTEEAVPPDSTEEGVAAGEQPLAQAQQPQDAEPQPAAATVTLALTPQQSQLLALAQDQGAVWLSLRSFGDEGKVELGPATLP